MVLDMNIKKIASVLAALSLLSGTCFAETFGGEQPVENKDNKLVIIEQNELSEAVPENESESNKETEEAENNPEKISEEETAEKKENIENVEMISVSEYMNSGSGSGGFETRAKTAQNAKDIISDGGTVFLKADTSLSGIDASDDDKIAAVKAYAEEYLTGDYEKITAAVSLSEDEYIVTLTDSDSNTAQKKLSDLRFVNTTNVLYDDYNKTDASEYLPRIIAVAKGTSLNIGDGSVKINGDTKDLVQNYIERTCESTFANPLGKRFVYKTRIKIEDFMDLSAGEVSDDNYTSRTNLFNGLYNVSFTIEKDGLYYKTNDNGTEIWKKAENFVPDNEYHNYKVIADIDTAAIFVDGTVVAENVVLPKSKDSMFGFTVGYKAKAKTAQSDNISVLIDEMSLDNWYENKVFMASFDSFDEAFEADSQLKLSVLDAGATEVENRMKYPAYSAATGTDVSLIYRVPKNSVITDIGWATAGAVSKVQLINSTTNDRYELVKSKNSLNAGVKNIFHYPWNCCIDGIATRAGMLINVAVSDSSYDNILNNEYDTVVIMMKQYSAALPTAIFNLYIEYKEIGFDGVTAGNAHIKNGDKITAKTDGVVLNFGGNAAGLGIEGSDVVLLENGESIACVNAVDKKTVSVKPENGFKYGKDYEIGFSGRLLEKNIKDLPDSISFSTYETDLIAENISFDDGKCSLNLVNRSPEKINAALIIVSYKDGMILDMASNYISVPQNGKIFATTQGIQTENADRVTVMVWDNLQSRKALIKTIEK